MLKIGSFGSLSFRFIATVVSVAMVAMASADPKGKQDSKKSPPGQAKEKHENHGDSKPSPPGQAKDKGKHPKGNAFGHDKHGHDHNGPGGSVLDLLGIEDGSEGEEGEEESDTSEPQGPVLPTTPETTTGDPFADIEGENGDEAGRNNGPALGSVPLIRDDEESTSYLLDKLVAGAQESAWKNGEQAASVAKLKAAYSDYAKKLVKTLSKLSQEEQNFIFYGRKH